MQTFAAFRQRFQDQLLGGMEEQLARLSWTAEQVAAHQTRELRSLVAHAQAASPFHARRLKGLDPGRLTIADLPALPVMTKAEMMASFDEVLTDRAVTRAEAEDALARTTDTPQLIAGRCIAFASGGSSGVRGLFVWDEAGACDLFAALRREGLRMARAAGAQGATTRMAIVAGSSAVHMTGSARAMTAGAPDAFVTVPATMPIAEAVDRLNAMQPDVLYGYPSMLRQLAGERAAGRLAIAPRLITSTSETLTPELRAAIREGFGAPIVNTFGSSEGLSGHSRPDGEALTFNTDMCIVELVDEANRPVPPGTPSARVLLTNLVNRLQPLIRYELSDRFVQVENPASGHLCARVEGRADDVLRYGALAIHPHAITSVMVRRPEVADYLVAQVARGLEVTVQAAPGADTDAIARALRESLARAGLPDPQVSVRAVPVLPKDARTGKLRRIVPMAEPALV